MGTRSRPNSNREGSCLRGRCVPEASGFRLLGREIPAHRADCDRRTLRIAKRHNRSVKRVTMVSVKRISFANPHLKLPVLRASAFARAGSHETENTSTLYSMGPVNGSFPERSSSIHLRRTGISRANRSIPCAPLIKYSNSAIASSRRPAKASATPLVS